MQSQELKRTLGILAVVAGFVAAVACGGGSGASMVGPTAPAVPPPTTTGPADVTITINSMSGAQSFTPATAAIKVGQKVAWVNGDATTHTATGSGFDTGAIQPGATSAPITFTTAGNIAYHCSIHPSMVGTLSVTQ